MSKEILTQNSLPGFEKADIPTETEKIRFRIFSPSFIEKEEKSNTSEMVRAQILGILGHGQYRITVAALRKARKNQHDLFEKLKSVESEIEEKEKDFEKLPAESMDKLNQVRAEVESSYRNLQRVPIDSQQEFEDWKNSHQFFRATGRKKNRKKIEGSKYSAKFVQDVWNSIEAQTLQRDVSLAFSNMIELQEFPPESDPKAIVNEELEFHRNVDFGFSQWTMNGVFDFVTYSSAEGMVYISDVKFVSDFELTEEKKMQVFLYTVMAKMRQRKKKSKVFTHKDMRFENIRFHYAVFQKWPIPKFKRIDASITAEEQNYYYHKFFEYSKRVSDQEIDRKSNLRKAKRSEVMMPFIAEKKDIDLPKQPRLIYLSD